MEHLSHLETEKRNRRTMNLDQLSLHERLQLMNEEDQQVAKAVNYVLPQIENVVIAVVEIFKKGGRLIYIGAGTSGRLGILDAVECVPTFGTPPELVQGLIAGGNQAMWQAVEGAEDDVELAKKELADLGLSEKDIVIGLAASGRTPYVIGGLTYANEIGAASACVCCNTKTPIGKIAKNAIEVAVGPEILTGSTRLKAGTAQKLILNMISTMAMIELGKVYQNLMVDVRPTNKKLVQRAKSMIVEATGCRDECAEKMFEETNQDVKLAIVRILYGVGTEEAKERLRRSNGFIRQG